MRILMITSEWPTPEYPHSGNFVSQQVEFLKREGVEADVFLFRGHKNPLNYIRARKSVLQKYPLEKYDIVHCQSGQSSLITIGFRKPRVITFIGSDLLGTVNQLYRYTLTGVILTSLCRFMSRVSSANIVVASFMRNYIPGKKAHVIPAGIDHQKFRPGSQARAREILDLDRDPGKKYILFAANPERSVKRYYLAREAVNILREKGHNVEILVAGDVRHQKMKHYYNASNCLVLTSLHEGSPNVVKEAMACNLRVVSCDIGDVGERIDNYPGSCIVPVRIDAQTLSEALLNCLEDESDFDYRSAIIKQLDEREMVKKLVAVYRSVLKS